MTLYLGDCMAIAPTLQGVDAVISDPPYGIGYKGLTGTSPVGYEPKTKPPRRLGGKMIAGDDEPFDPAPWMKYPIAVLWGANHYCATLEYRGGWLIWDKRDGTGEKRQSDGEVAWISNSSGVRIFRYLWQGIYQAGEKGQKRMHQNQKPTALMRWCMDRAKVPEGATVLDPYMGSGSTIIAAIRTGRRAIGIELDPAHYANAVERIKRELSQGDLFHSQHNVKEEPRRG